VKTLPDRQQMAVLVVVVLLLLGGWLAYKPALGGSFLLDDAANLGDLQHIDDAKSALRFIFSGSAGPIGRPLALASFLPQASSWDEGAAPFLAANIFLHFFNALLVGGFLYQLTLSRRTDPRDARFIAVAAMALWLFMPLLASASLMVVQRMTTLSATFVLVGLNAYFCARKTAERGENKALAAMTLALVVPGALSILSKENGVLLPVLILVTELTLLSRPEGIAFTKWRTWVRIVLVFPTLLVVGYLAIRVPYSEELVLRRDYTAWERLLTQSRVLWEYLINAFVPRPGHFGPYHDAYPVARNILSPLTLLAVLAWTTALILSVIWRRRYPVVAFAVLWFLAGHLLESTTIPLEMYFEHRNYIPIIGPVFTLCYLALQTPNYRLIVRMGLSLYILVNALFLYSQTSMWGNPQVSARFWHMQFPNSVRAATALATEQMSLEGPSGTLMTLREFSERHPKHSYIRIPELTLTCVIAPEGEYQAIVEVLKSTLPEAAFSYTAGRMLAELAETAMRGNCKSVDDKIVEELAKKLLSNPRYKRDTAYNQFHQQIMAKLARYRGDTGKTLEHLKRAIELKPSPDLNMMVVTTLASDGQTAAAREFIEQAYTVAPLHPFRRYVWTSGLKDLRAYVDAVEKNSKMVR
jgi:protein O-mannosyl-transferase